MAIVNIPRDQLREELTANTAFGTESAVRDSSGIIEPIGNRFIPHPEISRQELERLWAISRKLGDSATLDVQIPAPTVAQLRRIKFDPQYGCWNLPTYQDPIRARYGRLSIGGVEQSSALAHRVMYVVFLGAALIQAAGAMFLIMSAKTKRAAILGICKL